MLIQGEKKDGIEASTTMPFVSCPQSQRLAYAFDVLAIESLDYDMISTHRDRPKLVESVTPVNDVMEATKSNPVLDLLPRAWQLAFDRIDLQLYRQEKSRGNRIRQRVQTSKIHHESNRKALYQEISVSSDYACTVWFPFDRFTSGAGSGIDDQDNQGWPETNSLLLDQVADWRGHTHQAIYTDSREPEMCLTLKSIIIPTCTSGKCLSWISQLIVIISQFTARWAATPQAGLYPAERADKHITCAQYGRDDSAKCAQLGFQDINISH
ncbi:hypothetical protein BM1_08438 [Bipolaris maydis]|nr:hypothetical protein BM1_08438 [Bipolaris maydis]